MKTEQPEHDDEIREGYRPSRKGYQPERGHLDPDHPPKGGSGVPPKPTEPRPDSGSAAKGSPSKETTNRR